MKGNPRAPVIVAAICALACVGVAAADLGAREARLRIAEALGLDKPDAVRIKAISTGMGGEAVVEAQLEASFRLTKLKDGSWRAVEVRTGDRRWESIELVQTAVLKEKILRTTADMRTLVTGLEAFRRENGGYVTADSGAGLVDKLSPRFIRSVIRLDAWSNEFAYRGTPAGYRLESSGPDGKPGTGDEIVFENGQLVKGAVE